MLVLYVRFFSNLEKRVQDSRGQGVEGFQYPDIKKLDPLFKTRISAVKHDRIEPVSSYFEYPSAFAVFVETQGKELELNLELIENIKYFT